MDTKLKIKDVKMAKALAFNYFMDFLAEGQFTEDYEDKLEDVDNFVQENWRSYLVEADGINFALRKVTVSMLDTEKEDVFKL